MPAFAEDRIPPRVMNNQELHVMEGGSHLISTDYLSAMDGDSPVEQLLYRVKEGPRLGHLAWTHNPG